MKARYFAAPVSGDVVLCRVPDLNPANLGVKMVHPVVILKVIEPSDPNRGVSVVVCIGSSNRSRMFDGDFEVCRATHPVEFARAGLRKDTRFKLATRITLPYTNEWFVIPSYAEFGRTPKIGSLHPLTLKRVEHAQRVWAASPFNPRNAKMPK